MFTIITMYITYCFKICNNIGVKFVVYNISYLLVMPLHILLASIFYGDYKEKNNKSCMSPKEVINKRPKNVSQLKKSIILTMKCTIIQHANHKSSSPLI